MRVTNPNRNPKITEIKTVVTTVTTITENNPKQTIHNVFIVDASGSMWHGKYENAILGVNELLTDIKNDIDTENTVTIVEFEGTNIVRRVDLTKKIPTKYTGMGIDGSTPLLQAIGETIEYVISKRNSEYNNADKILINILTDGGENSSQGKFSNKTVLDAYIKEVQDQGVTVTFIGTQQEVNYAVQNLSVSASNTVVHDNTAMGIKSSYDYTRSARTSFSKKVSKGEDVKVDFYSKSTK